tara:strand:- start:117 stop:644 length:528 start_codon:yes stop_codon:yes gene_type:complete
MKGHNKFQVYLNSANAIIGSTTPYRCSFDLSSIWDNFAPQSQRYSNNAYCYAKVSYFSVKKAYNNNAIMSSIHIDVNKPFPNNISSQTLSTTNSKNFKTSNKLAILSTNSINTTYTYGGNPNQSFESEYVCVGNIFNGMTEFYLYDNTGTDLILAGANPWEMVLQVYFEDEDCNC